MRLSRTAATVRPHMSASFAWIKHRCGQPQPCLPLLRRRQNWMSPVAMTISANMRTGRPKGCPTPKSAPSRRRFSLTFLTSRARGLHQHPPSNGPSVAADTDRLVPWKPLRIRRGSRGLHGGARLHCFFGHATHLPSRPEEGAVQTVRASRAPEPSRVSRGLRISHRLVSGVVG